MCQRVLIATALAVEPQLLIADEPTTALDVTIQAQIVNLLAELTERVHLAMLFITHDLGLAARLCDRILVMYSGLILEQGPVGDLFTSPHHPYTDALLRSRPATTTHVDRLTAIPGTPPSALNPPSGCPFHPRCPNADSQCADQRPSLMQVSDEWREVACWKPITVASTV
jgi:oligopeptide/dipeptide ABC transporter ATP-binding protein